MQKTHLTTKNGNAFCGRDKNLGAGRTKEIHIVGTKQFISTLKRNPEYVCIECLNKAKEVIAKKKNN